MRDDYTESDWLFAAWRIEQDRKVGLAIDWRLANHYRHVAAERRALVARYPAGTFGPDGEQVCGRMEDCTADMIDALIAAQERAA